MHQSPRVVDPKTLWVTIVGVCFFLGLVGAATSRYWMESLKKERQTSCETAVAAELVQFALKNEFDTLRKKMKSLGAEKTHECVVTIDGRLDRFGQARMDILKIMTSMKNEGLDSSAKTKWALALESSAKELLRPGQKQDEFLEAAKALRIEESQRNPADQNSSH